MVSEELIVAYLKGNLSHRRYNHSINVRDTAIKLASIYGCDIEKARIAGLVHDCAREMKLDDLIDHIKQEGFIQDPLFSNKRELLHGPAAVHLCKYMFHIFDEDILSAVRYHTTGKENMTILEKIIFLSDFIEPARDFPGVDDLRKLAENNINSALLKALDSTIEYILKGNRMIFPDTIYARNYIIHKMESGD